MSDQYGPLHTQFSEPTPQVGDEAPVAPTVPEPSWGIPPSQTTAAQGYATSALQSTQSILQSILSAAGLDVPATTAPVDYSLPAPTGGDNFTKSFLTGVDPQQRAAAAALGQTIPQDLGDDRVYMGNIDKSEVSSPEHIGLAGPTDAELAGPGTSETKHKTTTINAALNQPYLWSDDKVSETMKKMREAGLNVTTFEDMEAQWKNLVIRASRTFVLSGGDNLVTPWDMLSATKRENIANGTIDKNGNIVRTSTSTSVNTLSEGQAWETLRATVQDMLGRDPSDQEVRDFLSMANNDAAQDPSKTVSTTHTDTESGTSNTTSHTTGGYTSADAAKSAYEQTHNTAEYADYQAAGPLFNTLLSALGEAAGGA
jgi:hypothetical protein